jgi:hypothetical protein
MAEIIVRIEYEGAEQGAQQLDQLIAKLEGVTSATHESASASTAANTARIAANQQIEQLGGALGQVGSTLARVNPEFGRLAGTIGTVAGSLPALTGSLGPVAQGMAAMTIAVDLGSQAWEHFTEASEDSIESMRLAAEQAGRTAEQISTLVAELRAEQRADRIAANRATQADISSTLTEAMERAEQQAALARDTGNRINMLESRSSAQRVRIAETTGRRFFEIVQTDQASLVRLRAQFARETVSLAEAQAEAETAAALTAIDRTRQRRGGGGGRESTAIADAERTLAIVAATDRRIEAESDAFKRQIEENQAQRDTESTARRIENERLVDAAKRRSDQLADRQHLAAIERIEKEKSARTAATEARRAENAEIASALTSITQSVTGAFEAAIEGEKSLEEALVEATKQILKQFGIELVAKGIGKILEGIAEIPSPTAATKIGGGAAMVGFGIGLGAAGAAIPSAPSGAQAESPREDRPTGDGGGARTLVINMNNPVMAAATQAQLARGLRRQMAADRTIGPGIGN